VSSYSSYTGYLVETFVTLLAVCALAFIVLWGARRLGIGRANGPIELYGHLPLEGRRAIYLVKVGAQVFVVGVGEGGFTKLGEIPAKDLPAPLAAAHATRFTDVLARSLAAAAVPAPSEGPQRPEQSERRGLAMAAKQPSSEDE
jgi:flagellar protein FliO/FliZ